MWKKRGIDVFSPASNLNFKIKTVVFWFVVDEIRLDIENCSTGQSTAQTTALEDF